MTDTSDAPLTAAQRRQIERLLDRIEDRLYDAPVGLHNFAGPASEAAMKLADELGISEADQMVWARWNGIDLGHGEAHLWPLEALAERTAEAGEEELLTEGDLVIGHYGRDDFVLPRDPWEEGADVVLVDEAGQRGPYASTLPRLILGIMAELSVLLDDGGEYRDELFGEDGELEPSAERKLLRRHLDMDEDAPLVRYRLAQLLRRHGEARAAAKELDLVLRRAPEFAWARFELGRARLDLDDRPLALREFKKAAESVSDASLAAMFYAWAALAAEGEQRTAMAAEVESRYGGFVAAQEAGAREALEDEVPGRAKELIELGLAVSPRHLGLLSLRDRLPETH